MQRHHAQRGALRLLASCQRLGLGPIDTLRRTLPPGGNFGFAVLRWVKRVRATLRWNGCLPERDAKMVTVDISTEDGNTEDALTTNIGWTEEAREAALAARRAHLTTGGVVFGTPRPLPYKAMHRAPDGKWRVLAGYKDFPSAYNHVGATHVLQTHGTAAEGEQQARGAVSGEGNVPPSRGANMARGAIIGGLAGGFAVGGPVGAAVGVAAGALMGSKKEQPLYELPSPILSAVGHPQEQPPRSHLGEQPSNLGEDINNMFGNLFRT